MDNNQRFYLVLIIYFGTFGYYLENVQRYQSLFSAWPDIVFYFSPISHKNHKDELETNSRRTRDEPITASLRALFHPGVNLAPSFHFNNSIQFAQIIQETPLKPQRLNAKNRNPRSSKKV